MDGRIDSHRHRCSRFDILKDFFSVWPDLTQENLNTFIHIVGVVFYFDAPKGLRYSDATFSSHGICGWVTLFPSSVWLYPNDLSERIRVKVITYNAKLCLYDRSFSGQIFLNHLLNIPVGMLGPLPAFTGVTTTCPVDLSTDKLNLPPLFGSVKAAFISSAFL